MRRLLLMTVVVAVTAPVLGGGAAPPVLVPGGVTLAGVPVGGMSFEEAQAAVAPGFAQPVHLSFGRKHWRVFPSRFGISLSVADGVTRAMQARNGEAVQLVPQVDRSAAIAYVRALDKRFSLPPKDAELTGLQGLQPVFSDATAGRKVMVGATTRRLLNALSSPQRRRVRIVVRPVAPKVTVADFGPVIVIRRGVNELRYYVGAHLVRTFGVATGQAVYPTPTGMWHIVDMQLNPWWRPPDSPWAKGLKPIPPGPGNPLGTRWMGLDAAGVGIHGTPDDASIGYSASHGCIRMHIPDAEWLFQHVHLGTPVVITDA